MVKSEYRPKKEDLIMKLYELVNQHHIGTTLSCAEAMLKACDEYYHLELSKDSKKMFSIMGLGMQNEISCCGAFTVAVGIIGLMTCSEEMSDYQNVKGYEMVSELTDEFIEMFSTVQCCKLQELDIDGFENPCHFIVEELARKLEGILSTIRPQNTN